MLADRRQTVDEHWGPHFPLISQFKTSCRTVNVWLGFVLPVFFSHIRGADEEIVANGGLGTFSMKDRGMGKIV
jgi:hypothetical protein